jgi:hypothetical protein
MATINPFQGPINYSVDVQSPFEAALSGFKIGSAGAEAQAKTQALEQAKKGQTELAALFKNPNATAADYERVTAFLPKDQAAIVTQGFERKTKAQQENDIKIGGQVYSAIKSGEIDIAKTLLQQQVDAYRTGGREQEAKATETYLQLIDMNPTGAQATVGLMMASMPGGKEVLENVDKTLSTGRAEALALPALNRAVAEADEAVSKAQTALATAANAPEKALAEANLATATAKKAQVDVEFARENALADIAEKAAKLKLTNLQAGSALAATNKLKAELKALESSDGMIPVDKRPEVEAKFRKEYSDQTKGYQDVKAAYGRILAVSDPKTPDEEGAADLALVFNFMKMQDPGSTVNSGEFSNAQNSSGVPDRLRNTYNRLITGGRLTSTQRKSFTGQAENLYKVSAQQEDIVRKGVDRIAKGYGLKTENIFYTPTEIAPTALPRDVPAKVEVFVTLPNGKRAKFPNQAEADAFKTKAGIQ